MERKILYFLIGLAMLSLGSCGNKQKADSATTESDSIAAQGNVVSIELFTGTYEGVLACNGCPGIKTEVQMNNDRSYVIISKYLTKKGEELRDSGFINIIRDDIIELESQNMLRKTYFKVTDSALYVTNPDGVVILQKSTDSMDKYTLLKK